MVFYTLYIYNIFFIVKGLPAMLRESIIKESKVGVMS